MGEHRLQPKAASGDGGGYGRAKTIPGLPCTHGRTFSGDGELPRETAALQLREALSRAGVSYETLANKLGVSKSQVQKRADPDHRRSWSGRDLAIIHEQLPSLYHELLHVLQQGAPEDGEPYQSPDAHSLRLVVLVAGVVDAIGRGDTRAALRRLQELRCETRQTERDLRKGDR